MASTLTNKYPNTMLLTIVTATLCIIGQIQVKAANFEKCDSNRPISICPYTNCDRVNTLSNTGYCYDSGYCTCKLAINGTGGYALYSNDFMTPATGTGKCKLDTTEKDSCLEKCGGSKSSLNAYLCPGNLKGRKLCYCARKQQSNADYIGCKFADDTGNSDQFCPFSQNCDTKQSARAFCRNQRCSCENLEDDEIKMPTIPKAGSGCIKKTNGFCQGNCGKDFDGYICPGNRADIRLCYCAVKK